MLSDINTKVDRAALARVFSDPKTLLSVETALATVQDTPAAVNLAQATADEAIIDAATAQGAANLATTLANAAQADIDALLAALGVLAYLDTINNTNWLGAALSVGNGGTGATTAGGARTNLGLVIGADVQAHSANLDTYAGIAPSANVQSILSAANYAAIRTLLGLGSLALLNTINGGNWSGADLAVGDGGTGASSASAARTNLDAAQTPGSSVANATDTGYLGRPVRVLSANDQIYPADAGKLITQASGGYFITIYPVASSAFPVGGSFEFHIEPGGSAGQLIPQAGVTFECYGVGTGTRTVAAGGRATVRQYATNKWNIRGEGIT